MKHKGTQGDKTHDQHTRIVERKEGLAAADDRDAKLGSGELRPGADRGISDHRVNAFPGTGLTNKESRDHNKHNNAGQDGHKRQTHTPAEQKS